MRAPTLPKFRMPTAPRWLRVDLSFAAQMAALLWLIGVTAWTTVALAPVFLPKWTAVDFEGPVLVGLTAEECLRMVETMKATRCVSEGGPRQ